MVTVLKHIIGEASWTNARLLSMSYWLLYAMRCYAMDLYIICMSVCLVQAGIVSKWLNLQS